MNNFNFIFPSNAEKMLKKWGDKPCGCDMCRGCPNRKCSMGISASRSTGFKNIAFNYHKYFIKGS